MISYAKWAINDRCNLNCPYCLASGKVDELPLSKLLLIVDKLKELGIEHIDFFGKEPLLNGDIFALVDYADKKMYDFTYSLITNGKNLSKFTPEIISRNFIQVAVSYDGGYGGREYVFDLEQSKPLINSGIQVEYSLDIHRNTLPHITELCDKIIKNGGSSLYIKPIIPHTSQHGNSLASPFYVTPEEFLECIKSSIKYFEGFPMTFSIPFQFNSIVGEALRYESETTSIFPDLRCEAGNSLYISSNGKAYGCGVIHYDNPGYHCIDILCCSINDLKNLCSTDGCRFCIK